METLDFAASVAKITQRAYELNIKGRKEGLSGLENDIDEQKLKDHDVFEIGIKLMSDGIGCENIDKILSGKVNLENDESLRQLKIIQKEAVLCIQKKYNSWNLFNVIFSYINRKETEKVQKHLKDKIFTEYFRLYHQEA